MKLIEGNEIASKINNKIQQLISLHELKPRIKILYISKNEASELYIQKKQDLAKKLGINVEILELKSKEEEIIKSIEQLNSDKSCSGYMIQLPIPKELDIYQILSKINSAKDIDGLSPLSLGQLYHNQRNYNTSATALAVIECLKYAFAGELGQEYVFDLENTKLTQNLSGKNVLIINHSLLVGKPLSALMLQNRATVTVGHIYTKTAKLKQLIGEADIIISATGVSGLIRSNQLQDNQIVIDVGINKSALGVGGDIEFDREILDQKQLWLSPVPDGVGPVTVSMLLHNATLAAIAKKDSK